MSSETAPFCVSATGSKGGDGKPRPHGHVVLAARLHDALYFAAGAVAATLVLLAFASFLAPTPVPNLVAFPSSFPPSSSSAAAAPRARARSTTTRTSPTPPPGRLGREARGVAAPALPAGPQRHPSRRRPRGHGLRVAAVPVRRRGRRQPPPPLPQEQARLRLSPRHGALLQHGAAAAEDGRVLGQDPRRAGRDAGPPRGRVGLVARRRRRHHRHGRLPPARHQVPRPQPRPHRLGQGGVRQEVLGRPQRRRLPHPQLPVVARLHGRVGQDGPGLAGLRRVGEHAHEIARRQARQRVRRPVRARLPAPQEPEEMGRQDVPRQRVLLPGVLGGDRRPPRRHRGAVQGGGEVLRAGAPPTARRGRARAVRRGEERGRQKGHPRPRRRRAEGGLLAAPVRHALHGMQPLRRQEQQNLLQEELRRRDAPRPQLRRRPGAARLRVPPRRAAQREDEAAPVRLPRRAVRPPAAGA